MSEYKNLDLRIHNENGSATYSVEATGPLGERASGLFGHERLAGLGADLASVRRLTAGRAALERVGTALFAATFDRDVLRLYDRARSAAGEGEDLRLRLHLPPELARLPWELLNDQSSFLAFDPRYPIIRYLDLPDTPAPLAAAPPLRLLHLVASPVDVAALDSDKEAALLTGALSGLAAHDLVEVTVGRPGTLAALRRGLQQGCHVLHFSGHGGFAGGEGFLLFEEGSGHQQAVDRDTLAYLLRGSQVRLAVLNACESALASDSDAFTSVAAALVRAGLPAVIAHQCPMPDASAVPFAAEFYRALADDLPVDAAVCEGRKAILSELGAARWRRADWAVPVLFMRSPDGHILDLDRGNGNSRPTDRLLPHYSTTVHVESINGGVVNIGAIGGAAPAASESATTGAPVLPGSGTAPPGSRLPALLGELRGKIRLLAPREAEPRAREQVATLERALAAPYIDPVALAGAWRWFQSELPSLSGAVLSIIREARPLAERQGEATLDQYILLFDNP
jgi:hypothetical protein